MKKKKKIKKAIEHEYVPVLEHKRIVKDLEEKLSETVAKNLELDEMKEKYSKEVTELKESLLACQEQLKNAQIDINVLKKVMMTKKQNTLKVMKKNAMKCVMRFQF